MIYVLMRYEFYSCGGWESEILSASNNLEALKLWHNKNGDFELSNSIEAKRAYDKFNTHETIREVKEA